MRLTLWKISHTFEFRGTLRWFLKEKMFWALWTIWRKMWAIEFYLNYQIWTFELLFQSKMDHTFWIHGQYKIIYKVVFIRVIYILIIFIFYQIAAGKIGFHFSHCNALVVGSDGDEDSPNTITVKDLSSKIARSQHYLENNPQIMVSLLFQSFLNVEHENSKCTKNII